MTSASGFDILGAYRYLLGREPEDTLDLSVAASGFGDWKAVREYFLNSPEASVALLSQIRALPQLWTKVTTKFSRQIYLCLADIGVAREILLTGDHEPLVGEAITQLLPEDGVFLDIGANIGWFTLLAGDKLARAGKGGRVIAVEGNPAVLPYLCSSVVESGLAGQVIIQPYAVSNKIGFVGFDSSPHGNLGGQRALSTDAIANDRRQIVPTVCLDDILADIDRIDLVKIDIEGSEPLALQGARSILEKFKPIVICEVNAEALAAVTGFSPQHFVELFYEIGYEPFSIELLNDIALEVEDVRKIVEEYKYCDFIFRPRAQNASRKPVVTTEISSESVAPACLVCRTSGQAHIQVKNYAYWKCPECCHLYIDAAMEGEFGATFYNSGSYKEIEMQWPKHERIDLFVKILGEVSNFLGRPAEKILDYGAGSLDLDEKLSIFPAIEFFDPNYNAGKIRDSERFDAIICTEVLEHIFDPVSALRHMAEYTDVIFATTLLTDLNFDTRYILPAGGHVSIFSLESVKRAATAAGLQHKIVFWPGQEQHYYHRFERELAN